MEMDASLISLPKQRVFHREDWRDDFARLMGYPRVGSVCIRVDILERISALLRTRIRDRAREVPTQPMQWLGCSRQEWDNILRFMGYQADNGRFRRMSKKKKTRRGV